MVYIIYYIAIYISNSEAIHTGCHLQLVTERSLLTSVC